MSYKTKVGFKVLKGTDQGSGFMKGIVDIHSFILTVKLIEYLGNPTRARHDWALKSAKKIISANPEYPHRYDILADVYFVGIANGSCESNVICLFKASEAIKKSFSLDENNFFAHCLSGYLFTIKREHDKAIASFKKSIELNPNGALSYFAMGWVLNYYDKPIEALEYLNKGIRLDPIPPTVWLVTFGVSYRMLGQYEKAIEIFKRCLKRQSNSWFVYAELAVAYSLSGQGENAKTAIKELLILFPDCSIDSAKKTSFYKNQDQLDFVVKALRKSGLPEK